MAFLWKLLDMDDYHYWTCLGFDRGTPWAQRRGDIIMIGLP